MSFENKTAIVTGATRGIGRAISIELAHRGCNVAFNYLKSSSEADSLVSELKETGREACAFQARVDDVAAVTAMVDELRKRFGSIDFLVNNAGIVRDRLLLRMTEADWDDVLDTNLKGAFNFSKAVVPVMIRARSGSILNISSVSGLRGSPGQVNYSASKAGMIGLTKALAKEVAGRNINVNSLALGFIDTEMTRGLAEDFRARILQEIPQGRLGTPEEVARIAVFLLSEDARYITGQVIQADGGLAI